MTSVGYSLESLVPVYPPQDDPLIESIVSSKKEFSELKPEAPRVDPIYYNSQVLYQRLHSEYDRIFLVAGAGSGKTGMAICFREWSKVHRPGEYKAYYFITGGTQIGDFKNQLVTKFAKGEYDLNIPSLTKGLSEKRGEKRTRFLVNQYIAKYYKLMTSGEFTKHVAKFSNEELKKEFSNVAIFIDEAQLIKIDPTLDLQILKSLQLGTNNFYESDSESSELEEDDDGGITTKFELVERHERERVETYTQIWRVCQLGENMKITISTARPTINHQDEMIYLMNLLLPKSKQIWSEISERVAKKAEVDVEWYNSIPLRMEEISTKTLESLMRGMIMYIAEPQTGAVSVYPEREEGETLSINPMYVIMSEFQTEAYVRAIGGVNLDLRDYANDEGARVSVNNNAFLNGSLQCANFVYPADERNTKENAGGLWGRQGLESVSDSLTVESERYIERSKKTKVKTTIIRTPKVWFQEYLRNLDNIKKSSAKMYEIVSGAKDNLKGKRYVSTRFYTYSGALVLGWCLKYGAKYDEYADEMSAFETTLDGTRRLKTSILPARRYAIITSLNRKIHNNIFDLFNSPENVRGDYIKVIIVTKVGHIGINLADVEYVDSLEGDWTPQAKYQSSRRAFRATSHVNSINWVKEQWKIKHPNEEPPENLEFQVYVNYYIALPDDKYLDAKGLSSIQPVDFQLYGLMEAKDRVFSKIFRKMKRIAVDGSINQSRNMLKGVYKDGSPECDYKKCEYPLYNHVDLPPDFSTYEAYYATRGIDETINLIKEYFANFSEATLDDLVKAFEGEKKTDRDVILGLERIIHNKKSIGKNRLGGEIYLNDDHGRYYLSNGRHHQIDASCSYYEANFIAVENVNLDTITLSYATDDIRLKIGDLYRTGVPHGDYVDFMYRQPIDNRSIYFENAVLRLEEEITDKERNIAENIIKTFSKVSMNLPNQYVNIMKRTNEQSERKKVSDDIIEEKSSPLGNVWVHYIYGIDAGEAKYDIVRRTLRVGGRLRILGEDGIWKDALFVENDVYSKILSNRILDDLSKFSKYPVIGIIVTSDTFHLRDNTKEDILKLAGRECKSLSKIEILNMMYRAGYNGPINNNTLYTSQERSNYIALTVERLASKVDADKIRADQMTDDMLRFYFTHAENTPPQLCYNFFKYLRDHNMIFDLLGTQSLILASMKEAARAKKGRPLILK